MPDSVLVVGEALIDVVTAADGTSQEFVGGSPANVALGLGRLGIPVRFHTALGADERAARITRHLASSGVAVEPSSTCLPSTSVAIARIAADGDARYEFDIDWRLPEVPRLGDERVVHVGSIACFVEPGASRVREAVDSFADRAAITFDPNIRPAITGDRDTARRVSERLASRCAIVKLSDEDAAWLYPAAAIDEVIARLLAVGAVTVAVTLGGEGAIIASADARVRVSARTVHPVDTVGAGDTFMATLVSALANGRVGRSAESLAAVGEEAVTAAAITVSRRGADLPTRAELDEVLSATRSR